MNNAQDMKVLIENFKKNTQKSLEEIDKTFNAISNNIKDTFNMYNDLVDTLARNLNDATELIKTKSNFVSTLDKTIKHIENVTSLFSQDDMKSSENEEQVERLSYDELMERKIRKQGKVY